MELPKRFENRPNGRIRLKYNFNGNDTELDYWIHRAPAVVGLIFAIHPIDGMCVLVIKRSDKMRDEPGKYGAPSGYLDFDETGYMGMTREVYEETSFYLLDYLKFLIFDNDNQPFFVQTDPKMDKHQNISLFYIQAYDFKEDLDAFPKYIQEYHNKETAEVIWMPLGIFFNCHLEWAFHHDERIKLAVDFLTKNLKKNE